MSKAAHKKDQGNSVLAELIAEELRVSAPESLLWIADEHPIASDSLDLINRQPVQFISNRFDQYRLAIKAGLDASFSDFSLPTNTQAKQIFFRAAKERPLVHHIINQAFDCLPTGGKLWLAGHKNEGIKTHISRASSLFGSKAEITRGNHQLSLAGITKAEQTGVYLDDDNYANLRQLQLDENQRFWTKPGLYGWNKIDQGSDFLLQTLSKDFLKQNDIKKMKVLDLGCGYGYLSRFIADLKPQFLAATDNCAGALAAAAKNLEHFPTSEVLASDAGDTLHMDGKFKHGFDLILCNPPFHQGFAVNDQLHKKFLTHTQRLLNEGGQAWYVINQFLPIEKHCANIPSSSTSLSCTEVARNNSFKVVVIEKKTA